VKIISFRITIYGHTQFVCPAMNKDTFKYNENPAQQGKFLKFIHHNFR